MSDHQPIAANVVPVPEAARRLRLPVLALRGLVDAGYLNETAAGIPTADLEAFSARNGEQGAGPDLTGQSGPIDPESLMEALEDRVDELSQQAYDRFVRVIPDARSWTASQRDQFVDQAKGRFGAILTVMSQGTTVDQTLRKDLQDVGAAAAWAGTSLPHLLLVLRISRDLLLQSAMRISEQQNGRLNAAVNAFAARLMPSLDRLSDALSDGYWNAKLDQQQEEWHRLANIIEGSPYAVYEADLDGEVKYANTAFAQLVGEPDDTAIIGRSINDVVRSVEGASIPGLLAEPAGGVAQLSFVLRALDGTDVAVQVDTVVRRVESDVVGFGGIIRVAQPETPPTVETVVDRVIESVPVDTSALVPNLEELRRSLSTLVDAGAYLDKHAEQMNPERTRQAGTSIRRQSTRLLTVVDQLDETRKTF